MEILKIYLLFWIFAILGWFMEVIVCSISDGKFSNRGFLIGPYCPIYGFGGILMLLFKDFKDNPVICFLLCMISCSILEYLTSYIMELMFKVRWWDYSNDKFNIKEAIKITEDNFIKRKNTRLIPVYAICCLKDL